MIKYNLFTFLKIHNQKSEPPLKVNRVLTIGSLKLYLLLCGSLDKREDLLLEVLVELSEDKVPNTNIIRYTVSNHSLDRKKLMLTLFENGNAKIFCMVQTILAKSDGIHPPCIWIVST